MKVVFLNPSYPPEMLHFTRGLAEVGATVYAVGDRPSAQLPDAVKPYIEHYLHVPNLMAEDDLVERVVRWVRSQGIDRVECAWEPLVLAAARIREALGAPGMSVDTVQGFRDKELMKQRIKAAGLRVPRSARCTTTDQAREAAGRIGYPLIIKPIAGAGSADTYKVRAASELEDILQKTAHVPVVSVEEFIEGEEFTYDTVCIDGVPAFENVAQYMPKPLEQRTQEWTSPIIITVRDLATPKMQRGIELGRGVLRALNMGDGFTHMEWFHTPSGEAVFGEIGCRPGGARLVDQMNLTCDIDVYREWARSVCWKSFEADTRRKYNVAIIFKRAQGQGRIAHIEGLAEFMAAHPAAICWEDLLPVGAPRRDWKQTLVSDGFIMLRNPDWDQALGLAKKAAVQIRMYAR